MKQTNHHTYSLIDYMKFIIPSLLGVLLFLTPFSYEGEITIPVAFLAERLEGALHDTLPALMTFILILIVLLTVAVKIINAIQPSLLKRYPFVQSLFAVSTFWLAMRILGMILALFTLYEIGPEWIWSEDTGGLALYDLIPLLTTIFLFAGFLLPLLLQFGLLEFVGTLMTKVMRPLFTLPGRSAIDSLASWMGDGTIGVLLSSKQYESGYYTQREAAVIGTTFSFVSITFTIFIISYLDVTHLFVPALITIVSAGLVAAVIIPRIPPLSKKPDTYYEPVGKQIDESQPDGQSVWARGFQRAVERAQNVHGASVIKGGLKNVLDMWIGVIPLVMAIGTTALIVAEYTPVFQYLGAPFIPFLQLLQVPEASAAAQTMVIGFADMFLPAVIGSGIETEFTRFVIACVSITQLIYMSEIGVVLLGSKLPVRFIDLVIIFLERTMITLPVIVLLAHLLL